MASYSETTAVQIRHGNHAENLEFCGLASEVTMDLGTDGTGTDINTTLRVHNGINSGGISLARADLVNVTTKALAEKRTLYGDKNLAYANLSNIETLTDSTAIELVLNTLNSYGLEKTEDTTAKLALKANVSMSNINTSSLAAGEGETGKHAGKDLAYKDMSNVDTASLATDTTGHGGANLAYANLRNIEQLGTSSADTAAKTKIKNTLSGYGLATTDQISELTTNKANKDMSNVDTADLAESNGHTGTNLAYYDESNVDTTNLTLGATTRPVTMMGPIIARADLQNVSNTDLNNKLQANNVEYTTNKINSITSPGSTDNYTSSKAVVDYVASQVSSLVNDYATINLNNVIDWNRLYESSDNNILTYNNAGNITSKGSGFTLSTSDTINSFPTIIPTSYALTGTVPLQLAIYNCDIDGTAEVPSFYRLYPEYGKTNIQTSTITFKNNYGSTATGTLYCEAHPNISGTYCYFVNIDSANVLGPDGRHDTSAGWESYSSINLEEVPLYDNINNISVRPVLCIQPTVIESGKLSAFNYLPSKASATVTNTNINAYHPMIINRSASTPTFSVQSGSNAKIVLSTITKTPGAGLLRRNFENLPGITTYDIACNKNVAWTINKNDAIPATTEQSISEREYSRIATIGQVWDALHRGGGGSDTIVTIRTW